jgi:hypothetical protein
LFRVVDDFLRFGSKKLERYEHFVLLVSGSATFDIART